MELTGTDVIELRNAYNQIVRNQKEINEKLTLLNKLTKDLLEYRNLNNYAITTLDSVFNKVEKKVKFK